MIDSQDHLLRIGMSRLLEIKDSDIRILNLMQCRDACDKAMHMGGAFSAIIPMVSLFYGGIINIDIENPTRRGSDIFILSKGHSVASLGSIYADLGYFDRAALKNSRSWGSLLKGHPGPILPGVPVSTGPLGQGVCVAQGLAMVGKSNPHFDVFTLVGDGELQEGNPWEAITFAGYKKLDNLCVIIDQNSGQSDDTRRLIIPLPELKDRFMSFGWNVMDVDAMQYEPIHEALKEFKFGKRNGRPSVIIGRTVKGHWGFSNFMNSHKGEISDSLMNQEMSLQEKRRSDRIAEFVALWNSLKQTGTKNELLEASVRMNLRVVIENGIAQDVQTVDAGVKLQRAQPRDKRILYDASLLPKLDKTKEYSPQAVVSQAMKVFARDRRIVSLDADLSTTSNLLEGVSFVDVDRGLNVGIAESNMMNIGEAYAVMGYNVWTSTFCPFWDWRVMRRIAISYQERKETIGKPDGWLSEGHNLDIVFMATAADIDTRTNGATHMGNDDSLAFDSMANLKIINVSCPQQLISVMRWVMEGNQGLIYLRLMRYASPVLYDPETGFEYGKAYTLKAGPRDQAVIISSGRAVHEALGAAAILARSDISAGVVDMPSIDEEFMLKVYRSGKAIFIVEQNNGYIWSAFRKTLFNAVENIETSRCLAINTLGKDGLPAFIHSGTYPQLVNQFGLSAGQIAETVTLKLSGAKK
jgi:transketolase